MTYYTTNRWPFLHIYFNCLGRVKLLGYLLKMGKFSPTFENEQYLKFELTNVKKDYRIEEHLMLRFLISKAIVIITNKVMGMCFWYKFMCCQSMCTNHRETLEMPFAYYFHLSRQRQNDHFIIFPKSQIILFNNS